MTTIVARSRFRLDRAISKRNKPKAGTGSEGSWPRSIVIGFVATMTVLVPYTTSWFLAQHIETRESISNLLKLQDDVWDPIRRRFGERDYAGDTDTYKFEDEPDCTIRRTHAEVVRRDQGKVTVKVIDLTDGDSFRQEEISVMPASTLAKSETFSKRGNIALEFPDDEATQHDYIVDGDIQEASAPPSTPIPYQVYSSWYYHPESSEDQTPSTQLSSRSVAASELAAIETELAQLDHEVKQGLAMDDPYVQSRLRQLKADRRRLQWSRWFGN